ncbi:MAG: hypothetical protein PHE51_03615 [Eubacteriales bacterium]|nr:hypothetical protein [Eubacteriales bacterium]
MKKGVVLEIRDTEAVILFNDGTMKKLPDKEYKIGQSVMFHKESYVKYLAVAACFMIFLFVGGMKFMSIYNTPESYLYVDINPSLRLDINRFNKVIDIIPLNNDAKILLQKHTINEKNPDECFNKIVGFCEDDGYLNENNSDIKIGVVSDNKKFTNEIKQKFTQTPINGFQTEVIEIDDSRHEEYKKQKNNYDKNKEDLDDIEKDDALKEEIINDKSNKKRGETAPKSKENESHNTTNDKDNKDVDKKESNYKEPKKDSIDEKSENKGKSPKSKNADK